MELYTKGREVEPEIKAQFKRMLPSVFADQFSVICLGVVNVIMAGNVSGVVLAGVGQVDAINMILVYVFNSFATAGTVIIAQHIGRNDRAQAEESMLQTLVAGTLFLTLLSVALVLVRTPVLHLLYPKVESAVMLKSLDYMIWSVPSLPLTFIFSQCAGALRSADSMRMPMLASIVMNLVNILLGFILIIGVGNFEGYGAFGAGVAIFTSRLIGATLLVLFTLGGHAPIRLHLSLKFRFKPAIIKELLDIGIPIALETFLFHSGRLMVQVIVATMGTVMISANQVAMSCLNIFSVCTNSYQFIIVTLVAQRVGAKSRQRSDAALRYVASMGEITNFFVGLTAFFSAPYLCGIFSSDPEIIRVAALSIRIMSPFFLLHTSSFTIPMGFRGAGDVRYPLVISVFSMWIFRVAFGYFLGVTMKFFVYGVIVAMGLDWVFRGTLYSRRMRREEWMEKIPR